MYIIYLRGIGGQYAFLYTVEYRQDRNENGNLFNQYNIGNIRFKLLLHNCTHV